MYQKILNNGLFESNLEEDYKNGFSAYINTGVKLDLLHKELLDFDLKKISAAINTENDLLFHYLGIQILTDRYFIKNRDEIAEIIELPQWFWMRVAMGLCINETGEVF